MINQSREAFELCCEHANMSEECQFPPEKCANCHRIRRAFSEGRRLGLEEAEIVADTDATKSCNLTGRRIAKAIRALIVGGGEGV